MFELLKEHICPEDEKFNTERWFKLFRSQYRIKSAICQQQNPKTILEIGVRAGYSALAFLTVCPNAKYVGIDFETYPQAKTFTKWAKTLLQSFDVEIWKLNTKTITSINLTDIDFCHIDGSHNTAYVLHDLDLCFEILSETGLILLDDMIIEKVNTAIRAWIEEHEQEINYEYIVSRTGEMLIRKAGNYDRFYVTK